MCAPARREPGEQSLRNQVWMQVIDRPQAVEDLAAITVPAACLRMSAAERLFVLVDEARVNRGIAAIPALLAGLSTDAVGGVRSDGGDYCSSECWQSYVDSGMLHIWHR